jgi:hypothetical protein
LRELRSTAGIRAVLAGWQTAESIRLVPHIWRFHLFDSPGQPERALAPGDTCCGGALIVADLIARYDDQPDRACAGCGYDGPAGHCHLCHAEVAGGEGLEHLRLMHPDRYGDGPQRWPDGSLVVLDATLEPGEFS